MEQMTTVSGSKLSWPELIGFMAMQRQQLATARPHAYPLTVPRVAASPEQIDAAEHFLGGRLDSQYREFLGYANGWPDFNLDAALLGTEDLGRGMLWERALSLLEIYYAEGPVDVDFPKQEDLLPIAVGTESTDVFAIWIGRPETVDVHPVLWLAGEEIDQFPSFRDFFIGVYELQKDALDKARSE